MLNEIFPLVGLGPDAFVNLLPLFSLTFGAIFCLLVGTHKTRGHAYAFAGSFFSLVIALFQGSYNLMTSHVSLLDGTLTFDPFTKSVSLMVMVFALIAVVCTYGQDKKEGLLSEIYALILFSTAGMILMMSTTHLLFLFIALEIMSLAVYVMVAMRRSSQFSAEAGLKYFILGGLASAFLLYGTSLVFGATGSFELVSIENYLICLLYTSPS